MPSDGASFPLPHGFHIVTDFSLRWVASAPAARAEEAGGRGYGLSRKEGALYAFLFFFFFCHTAILEFHCLLVLHLTYCVSGRQRGEAANPREEDGWGGDAWSAVETWWTGSALPR